jgi:hypothetical protein
MILYIAVDAAENASSIARDHRRNRLCGFRLGRRKERGAEDLFSGSCRCMLLKIAVDAAENASSIARDHRRNRLRGFRLGCRKERGAEDLLT